MKYLTAAAILGVSISLIVTSCKKETTTERPIVNRKVKFALYTDKDFSNNNENIVFKLSIQNSTNQILWDSVLPQMRIKNIPNFDHQIIVEKLIPNNDTTLLKVGFFYSIENVGNSWYLDSCNAGETFKAVVFDFQ